MNKRWAILISAVGLLIILLVTVINNRNAYFENPFETVLSFENPVYAASKGTADSVIIDSSKKRIIKVNPSGEVDFILEGGKREKGTFFFAEEITVDSEGYLYVINNIQDTAGFFEEVDEILRFDPKGEFDKVIFRQEYSNQKSTLVQRGQFSSIKYRNGVVSWIEYNDSGVHYYQIPVHETSNVTKTTLLPLKDANIHIASVDVIDQNNYIYSTKKGMIFQVENGKNPVLLYSGDANGSRENLSVPWWVKYTDKGGVYFTDIGREVISRIRKSGDIIAVLSQDIFQSNDNYIRIADDFKAENPEEDPPALYVSYQLSVNDEGVITTCNNGFVISIDSENQILSVRTSASYPFAYLFYRFAMWFFLILLIVTLFVIIKTVYVDFMHRKLSQLLVTVFGIIFIIAISAVLVTNMIVKNFSTRYQDEVLSKLSQMVQMYQKLVDGDKIEKIVNQSDFMNADYQAVREQLHGGLNDNQDEWNRDIYFAVYRVINDRLYGFMFLNDGIPMYNPFDYYDDEESIYRLAQNGEIASETDVDSWGEWLYSVGPLFNSKGEVVAIIEIGKNLYTFREENTRLVTEIIMDVVTMLIIFILLMIEFTFLGDMLKKRNESVAHKTQNNFAESKLARPLGFLFFIPISMSLAFIPLMMNKFYEPVAWISKDVLIALPISVEMFSFGLAIILTGLLLPKIGWRINLYIGLTIAAIGLLLSGLSWDMLSFILARAVTGFGSGFAYMAMRGFINTEQKPEVRDESFSNFYAGIIVGTNVGVVIGASLSDQIGFGNVFFVAMAMLVLVALFAIRYIKAHGKAQSAVKAVPLSGALKTFFGNANIILLFLLVIFPTYVAGTFLGYYFPLFAESEGLSTANIGRLFILNGIFIIYLGPVLSKYMEKYLGPKISLIVGSILWATSLLIFALTGSMFGAVMTLILMGITEGFCVSAQNSFFLRTKVVSQVGEDRAVGYFEVVGKIGETLGPIIFGFALILGVFTGMIAISIGIILALGLFLLASRKE